MTLFWEDFKRVLRRPPDVAVGVSAQFVVMPLLAFGIATMLRLPDELLAWSCIGKLLVTEKF